MKKQNNIKVGDIVTLHANNGLGPGRFEVLEVAEGDIIFRLRVRDANGATWRARIEGAKIVGAAPRGRSGGGRENMGEATNQRNIQMENMGYARNQLTVSDLRACLEALENEGLSNLNSSEFNYAKILANLAERYVDAYAEAFEEYKKELDDHHTQAIDDAVADEKKYRAQLNGLYGKK